MLDTKVSVPSRGLGSFLQMSQAENSVSSVDLFPAPREDWVVSYEGNFNGNNDNYCVSGPSRGLGSFLLAKDSASK